MKDLVNRILLLIVVSAFANLCMQAAYAIPPTGQLLSLDGFEPSDPPLVSFGAAITDRWGVENAALVTSPNDGVNAFGGLGMLEMYDAGGVVSQVAQHVDVTAYSSAILTGTVQAEGSIMVNAPFPNANGILALRARTAPTNTGGSLIATMSVPLVLDSDPMTWEQISVSGFVLPTNTTHVSTEILFTNATLPSFFGTGAFADNAFMQLVPEPSGAGLAAATLPLMLVVRRRRTASRP